MNEPISAPPSYPPNPHLLSDLRIALVRDLGDPGKTVATLEITPEMLDASGHPRLGVLATLVDVVAGETAIRTVLPNWAVTSDLSLYVGELPREGALEAALEIRRAGRQTIVLEVTLSAKGAPAPCGLSTLTFMVLPARAGDTKAENFAAAGNTERSQLGSAKDGFDQPIGEAIGLIPDPADPTCTRLPMRPYLVNSVGALQGGAGATLIEWAAERFAAEALGAPVRMRSLDIHYLKLGRVGPICARVRKIAETSSGLLVRVELRDEGSEADLMTLATLLVERDSMD